MEGVPTGDLGIRRGVQLVYEMKRLPTEKEVEGISEGWRPYRSVASMYLWHVGKLGIGGEDLRRSR